MQAQISRGLSRILTARQGLLDLRGARCEALQRFREYARERLGDFVANTDPITGMRIVELSAEGNRTTGELGIVLAFFEGTRLRVAVDQYAKLSAESTLPDALPAIGRVLDVVVGMDLARAELLYEPAGAPAGTRKTLNLADVLDRLIDHAAGAVEEALRHALATATPPLAAVPAAPAPRQSVTLNVA
jgi:hypothetical protein